MLNFFLILYVLPFLIILILGYCDKDTTKVKDMVVVLKVALMPVMNLVAVIIYPIIVIIELKKIRSLREEIKNRWEGFLNRDLKK